MHECPSCGELCDCDGEDHDQEAPMDCDHPCDYDEDEEGADYEAWLREEERKREDKITALSEPDEDGF